jgi:hypothetical protein
MTGRRLAPDEVPTSTDEYILPPYAGSNPHGQTAQEWINDHGEKGAHFERPSEPSAVDRLVEAVGVYINASYHTPPLEVYKEIRDAYLAVEAEKAGR